METKHIQTVTNTLIINGLTENDLKMLGFWYSYYTFNRTKGIDTDFGHMLGTPVVNKRTIKKGLKLFSNIINTLEDFESPLFVESLNEKENIRFKCKNKRGNQIVVDFEHGDLIDHPTVISIINENSVKRVAISLTKRIIFDKLNYCNYGTEGKNNYYESIYKEAYNIDQKKL